MGTWVVYMVRCSDGTLYSGCTNNLAARLNVHNLGRGARYTRSRLPVELVFVRRARSYGRALSVEARLKGLPRIAKLALIEEPRRVGDRLLRTPRARLRRA